jgi:ribosome maturation factor RimP
VALFQDRVKELLDPVVESERMELVDVECLKMKTRWLVRLFIDKDGGVTLDDCQKISNLAGDILDIHDVPPGAYTLEVSSPGLDRPLARDKDFLKFKGERVVIKTAEKIEGSRNFHGRLIDYLMDEGAGTVVLSVEGNTVRIPRHSIQKANLDTADEPIPRGPSGKRGKKRK